MADPMRIRANMVGDKVEVRVLMSHEMEISKNPFMHFRFKGGKPGEKVTISWVDNKGDKRTDEATISGG